MADDLRRMSLSTKTVRRVSEIFGRADLGDPRLVRRAVGLAEALTLAPDRSLPKVWSTPAELEAGYRFLRSPQTDFLSMMEPIQHATREAALAARRVLVLHDTTDIECPSADPDDVGYLQTGAPGFYVHHALCVREDETELPLGILWSELWGRPQRSKHRGRTVPGSELAKLEERESDRWLEGVTEAQLWVEGCEQVVHVMDREADSYRLFQHMKDISADFVVRMRHDRRTELGRVAEDLARAPVKLRRFVPLSSREGKSMPRYTHHGRAAREAELTVRSTTVELKPPSYLSDAEPLTLNVVQVLEEHAPNGVKPVSWVLITSLPVKTKAQVERVIDIYRARWGIEEFHKALKTGCMFEKRQLESFQSITTLLAFCYPIACELLRLRSRARDTRTLASETLRPSLLACLRAHPKARKLSPNPTCAEAMAVIAGLGGHIKQNGPPGWQTSGAGMIELLSFERGWLAAREALDL